MTCPVCGSSDEPGRKFCGECGTPLARACPALMLVIEGALPFLAPSVWRETFRRILQLSDGQIRLFGLTSMLIGLLLLLIVR